MSQTRNITVSLRELGNTPIVGARIIISLMGVGLDTDGFIAPKSIEAETDETGKAVFNLWQNNPELSNTYYQIRSYHPDSGRAIHRGEIFYVGNSDANLDDLINLRTGIALPPISDNTAPNITAINLGVVINDLIFIQLGDSHDSDGDELSYSVSPAYGVAVLGNEATISIPDVGVYNKTLTVMDGKGGIKSVSINLSVSEPSDFIEYRKTGVTIS